jgi:hypothetical protein
MDQRLIVLYLNRKSRTAQVIHDDLVGRLSAEATAYSTVMNYLRETRIFPRDATPLSAAASHHIDEFDEIILRILQELAFSSVWQLAHTTNLPVTTVYRRLSAKLELPPRPLRRAVWSNCLGPFWRYCRQRKAEHDMTSESLMRHGSTPVQVMNLHGSCLREEFRPGMCQIWVHKGATHYRMWSDAVCNRDRPREGVQIPHGLLGEQNADTILWMVTWV